MRILSTQYTLATKSLEIYISGCMASPHCEDCHNPESWDFDLGEVYDINYFYKIKRKVEEFPSLVKNIMIFGGEPLDQKEIELKKFLNDLYTLNKDIWLFTRHELYNVPQFVKDKCSYIKCGYYDYRLSTDDNIQYGIKLATSNQNIYKKGKDY